MTKLVVFGVRPPARHPSLPRANSRIVQPVEQRAEVIGGDRLARRSGCPRLPQSIFERAARSSRPSVRRNALELLAITSWYAQSDRPIAQEPIGCSQPKQWTSCAEEARPRYQPTKGRSGCAKIATGRGP